MKTLFTSTMAAVACMGMVAVSAPATAAQQRDHRWHDNDRNWDPGQSYRQTNKAPRRLGRNDRIYRGRDGRTYCRRSDGTTGLVIGGVAGGVLGNVVGGGTLGTLLGAGGGALLGRQVDRGNVKCK
ncbi:glycine zipper 2TM domain-containing protein [Sphingomonas sp.]|uniref:glycine zipper 2TM domain-containing protein n=1 Tax=Sphingomonas sp. TaxID=28214 RepID=UPI0028B19B5E|nr:glycine zipper 2TM domain-containing protein [Sphingomonas sp.]